MLRKYWRIGAVCGLILLPLIALLVVTYPQTVAGAPSERAPEQITQGFYRWNYSAKFVCGLQGIQTAPGEPPVKPGNYATEINIHNYNYREVLVHKKVIVLVDRGQVVGREPQAQPPTKFVTTTVGPDYGMMDDCNAIWGLVFPTVAPPNPMPSFIGYLVIISPLDLDVDAVYTAQAPQATGTLPNNIAIDVERVPGKRVFVPPGVLP